MSIYCHDRFCYAAGQMVLRCDTVFAAADGKSENCDHISCCDGYITNDVQRCDLSSAIIVTNAYKFRKRLNWR